MSAARPDLADVKHAPAPGPDDDLAAGVCRGCGGLTRWQGHATPGAHRAGWAVCVPPWSTAEATA